MKSNLFLNAFFIVSIIHLSGEAFAWPPVVFWTKILLMPLLLLGMLRGLKPNEIKPVIKIAIVALVWSTAGDLFLLNEKASSQALFFYLGLGAFMMAQISYILAFSKLGKLPIRSFWILVYLLYFAGFIFLLYPILSPVLLIAVALYGSTLTGMAWNSWRTWDVGQKQQIAGVAGAVLFLVSDSLLAINRFKFSVPYAGFLIMLTYIVAQYLIIQSIVVKSKDPSLISTPTY